jgi:hypothetical protein
MGQVEHIVIKNLKHVIMRISIWLSITFLSIFYIKGFAQDSIVNPTLKSGKLGKLEQFFVDSFNARKNWSVTNTLCTNNVTFMKFNISPVGKVENIEFNKTSNKALNLIFSEIIHSTDGLWLPATRNGVYVKSKPLIMPLIYELTNGCIKNQTGKGNKNFYDGFHDAVYDLSNPYTFGMYNGLDCILLKPFTLSPLY